MYPIFEAPLYTVCKCDMRMIGIYLLGGLSCTCACVHILCVQVPVQTQ